MRKSNRRTFVKAVSGLTLGTSLIPWSLKAGNINNIPQRILGRTGEKVSILGMGGYHVGSPDIPDEVAIQIIRTSIDRGINFMDNAWSYQDGRAETIMGLALKNGYREKVLLMTKIMARSVEEAKCSLKYNLRI